MDAQAKKILSNVWASGPEAEREDPESLGLIRSRGWPVSYEQPRSGKEPERTVFNQKFREVGAAFFERMRYGGVPIYDQEINYYQWARVIGSDGMKYYALEATGPAHGNISDPTTDSGNIWRLY